MQDQAGQSPALSFSQTVSATRHGAVLLVTIDNPPVNATGADVRAGLIAALDFAIADERIAALVLTGAGKTFVGGADISEFGKPPVEPTLPAVIAAIEASPKPVIAAINGAALGGGLELALACHGRIATASASLGLPEVTLGLVPGAGGTQRLPRLVGTVAAVDMIAGGKPVGAPKAVAIGLIDAVAGQDLIGEAVRHAAQAATLPLRRTGDLPIAHHDQAAFDAMANTHLKRARGRTAPAEAVRLVQLSLTAPLEQGLAEERATFLRLREAPESAALRHIFFAERKAGRLAELSAVIPRPLSVIGIAGTGLMGSGIAVATLAAGYRVIAFDQTEQAADAGRNRILALIDQSVKSGRLSEDAAAMQRANLTVSADPRALADADLVIEAVFDDLAVKTALFRTLDAIVRPDAILATNTSYLDPDEIAAATAYPARVVGLHFFSPANIMRLVEVVRCARTEKEILATVLSFARSLKKIPVVTGVCEGFVGNRIFSAYRSEAERLLEEGALPQTIDQAMEDYGFPMGPFTVFDMAGLEIAWARRKRQAASRDPAAPYCEIPDRLCEAGRFGRKSGRGWYLYVDDEKRIDPEIDQLIAAYRIEKGFQTRPIAAGEIITRLLSAMAREGEKLLSEGVAQSPDDIDLVLVNGYGFPAHRGGPMFAAASAARRA